MELLKFVRRRSFLSELLYAALNIALAVAVLLVVRYTGSVGFGISLIALSKWRVFAVRPRYWWANIRSNLVDFVVSVSFVIYLFVIDNAVANPDNSLLLMVLLTLLYITWLLWVKPRSKRSFVVAQAGVALFMGSGALFTVAYNWPVSLVVLGMWLLGSSAARHVYSAYDDEVHGLFLSLAWGLVIAEIGWVGYHWAVAYPLPFFPSLMLPQATLVVTLVSFVAYKAYDSFYHHAKMRTSDVLLPLLFTVSILIVLFVLFNRVGTAI